jgi:ABC-type proline/glycine betaine transport system permease subunit
MVLVFLCLGGWLPHHRRDTCNYGAAPMETRWTWLRAADTQAVRESRSSTERAVCHAPHRPAALPGILTGMRIAMAGAWTSIVAAELIAATSGLGYLIMQAGDYLNTALVFSGIIMIAIIALVLDACLRGLLLLADPSRRR